VIDFYRQAIGRVAYLRRPRRRPGGFFMLCQVTAKRPLKISRVKDEKIAATKADRAGGAAGTSNVISEWKSRNWGTGWSKSGPGKSGSIDIPIRGTEGGTDRSLWRCGLPSGAAEAKEQNAAIATTAITGYKIGDSKN